MSSPKTKQKTLRQIARELEKSSTSPSPADLADRMLASIKPSDYKMYLREALGVLAVTYKIDARRASLSSVVETSRGGGPSSRVKIPAERTTVMIDPVSGDEVREETPAYKKAKSYKVQMIRTEWENFLLQNLPTGLEKTPYILIGDATVEDLRRASAYRRTLAASNNEQADRYDRLATVMVLKNASTVGLLTSDDVKGML